VNLEVNISKEGLGGGNYAEKIKIMEKIYELSNRYFELIPPSSD
jgi:hypothetical protein